MDLPLTSKEIEENLLRKRSEILETRKPVNGSLSDEQDKAESGILEPDMGKVK